MVWGPDTGRGHSSPWCLTQKLQGGAGFVPPGQAPWGADDHCWHRWFGLGWEAAMGRGVVVPVTPAVHSPCSAGL